MSSLIEITGLKVPITIGGPLSRQDKKQGSKALLGIIRLAVCANQGEIAQQFLLGNEYHKRLRVAVNTSDKTKIRDALEKLNRLHVDTLRRAWRDSAIHLGDYFLSTHKSPTPPRMCLKSSITTLDANNLVEKRIVDVLREDGNRSTIQTLIVENTGFFEVANKGTYYMENDLPEAVKQRQYINPRLNTRLAASYKKPIRFLPKTFFRREDIEWTKCWDVGAKVPPLARNCYKSTLIVPMTLTGNSLSEEFLEDTLVGKAAKVDRSIYGFLCFDHPDREYFHEDDIHVGYIMADLLSIYRITSDALTSRSVLYGEARELHKGFENV